MVNVRPGIHVHREARLDDFFGPRIWGWCMSLPPHEAAFDFETCGLTAEPDRKCIAFAESTDDKCRNGAVVVLACATTKPGHYGRFHLCWAHLSRHRSGKPVRLAV